MNRIIQSDELIFVEKHNNILFKINNLFISREFGSYPKMEVKINV